MVISLSKRLPVFCHHHRPIRTEWQRIGTEKIRAAGRESLRAEIKILPHMVIPDSRGTRLPCLAESAFMAGPAENAAIEIVIRTGFTLRNTIMMSLPRTWFFSTDIFS